MTLRRMMLGKRLEELREQAGVSREDVAAELDCTPGRVRHLESGRNLPTRPDVLVMCNMYDVPTDVRDALLETRSEAQQAGWWQTYRLPKWLASYVMLEADATLVRNWEVELIPGLLQTEQYARRIATIGDLNFTGAEVEKRVSARLRRQDRLTDQNNPLRLEALISEAAIQRCAAEPDIAPEQLNNLLKVGELPNVNIQIVPMNLGMHHAMAGGFALLAFPPDTWPQTGYQEYNVGGHLVDDPEAVNSLGKLFDALQERALTVPDSARLILQYIG
ncbi:helix-turn-helix domain-containing protein [Saccharopolyspora indica]|uniref:helix-turn-helix domain-containing protein n=1 Tax=Saccharopolyspora indica TaxID=1229659 RepID=UPI0022EB6F09|nr:helix-turn-helix transcriptional regulator [Saccharopolyspora indica]MDA3649891.1 helix-turn-helix transcriptional regulator [Saccharopolyspora indica]